MSDGGAEAAGAPDGFVTACSRSRSSAVAGEGSDTGVDFISEGGTDAGTHVGTDAGPVAGTDPDTAAISGAVTEVDE